jgi:hypothetical protein
VILFDLMMIIVVCLVVMFLTTLCFTESGDGKGVILVLFGSATLLIGGWIWTAYAAPLTPNAYVVVKPYLVGNVQCISYQFDNAPIQVVNLNAALEQKSPTTQPSR